MSLHRSSCDLDNEAQELARKLQEDEEEIRKLEAQIETLRQKQNEAKQRSEAMQRQHKLADETAKRKRFQEQRLQRREVFRGHITDHVIRGIKEASRFSQTLTEALNSIDSDDKPLEDRLRVVRVALLEELIGDDPAFIKLVVSRVIGMSPENMDRVLQEYDQKVTVVHKNQTTPTTMGNHLPEYMPNGAMSLTPRATSHVSVPTAHIGDSHTSKQTITYDSGGLSEDVMDSVEPEQNHEQRTPVTTTPTRMKHKRDELSIDSRDSEALFATPSKKSRTTTTNRDTPLVRKFIKYVEDANPQDDFTMLQCRKCHKDPQRPRLTPCNCIYCEYCLKALRRQAHTADPESEVLCLNCNVTIARSSGITAEKVQDIKNHYFVGSQTEEDNMEGIDGDDFELDHEDSATVG